MRGSSDIGASVDGVLEVSGDFGALRVRHAKSKRGPAQGTFIVTADVTEDAVKLSYLDQEEKAENDAAQARAFVIEVLQEGSINKKGLRDRGREQGYGRGRIDSIVSELQEQGGITTQKQGKSVMLCLSDNNDDAAPPPKGGSIIVQGENGPSESGDCETDLQEVEA